MTIVDTETGEVVASRSLAECESVIERGLATFVEVGEALAEVRDAQLYKTDYDTFEAYCDGRWGMSRPRAYELIHAAEVTKAVSAIADTPRPANEGQARALRPVASEPAVAAEVMKSVAAQTGGKPTAKAIADEVERRQAEAKIAAAKAADDEVAEVVTRVIEQNRPDLIDGQLAIEAGKAIRRVRADLAKIDATRAGRGAAAGNAHLDLHQDAVDDLVDWLRTYRRAMSPLHAVEATK